MKRIIVAAALGAALVAAFAPPRASAQARDHEEGFFLRLSAGVGSAGTEATDGGTTVRFSGPGGDANFAIGGIVASNLALHGTLFGWSVSNPDIEIGSSSGTATGDLNLAGFGAGVTYYFMPVNIYLSGSLGLAWLEYQQGNASTRSLTGMMFDATVGKEWWVGDSWGLGVAIGVNLHSVPDEDISDNWSGGSASLRFSATMN